MAPLLALLPLVGQIFDKVFPDKAKSDEAKLKLLEMQQAGLLAELNSEVQLAVGQLDVNKAEAQNTNVFVSGWRPFVGWIGGLGLAYVAILEPIARFVATVFYHYDGAFPAIDATISLQVLLGMLGLGGLRTFEKLKNVASK